MCSNKLDIRNLQPIGVEQLPADDAVVQFLVTTVEANLCGEMEVIKGTTLEVLKSVAKGLIGAELEEEDGMYDEYDLDSCVDLMAAIDCHNQNADDQPVVFILNLDTLERII